MSSPGMEPTRTDTPSDSRNSQPTSNRRGETSSTPTGASMRNETPTGASMRNETPLSSRNKEPSYLSQSQSESQPSITETVDLDNVIDVLRDISKTFNKFEKRFKI